jgi:hypothetical protein
VIEKIPLYNESVVLEYDDDNHRYSLEGKALPSATGITKIADKSDFLIPWAVKLCVGYVEAQLTQVEGLPIDKLQLTRLCREAKTAHKRKTAEAGDIGNLVHDWIEAHIQSIVGVAGKKRKPAAPKMPTHPGVKASIESFLKWEEENDVEYIFTERKVLSLKHWFAGTLDILAVVKGVLSLPDMKTSKRVYDEHYLQTAAYKLAFEEEFPDEQIKQRLILHLPKETGTLTPYNLDLTGPGYPADLAGFLGARELYRRLKGL